MLKINLKSWSKSEKIVIIFSHSISPKFLTEMKGTLMKMKNYSDKPQIFPTILK